MHATNPPTQPLQFVPFAARLDVVFLHQILCQKHQAIYRNICIVDVVVQHSNTHHCAAVYNNACSYLQKHLYSRCCCSTQQHPSLRCCLQQRMQLFIETFIQHANMKTFIQRSITEIYEANYRNICIVDIVVQHSNTHHCAAVYNNACSYLQTHLYSTCRYSTQQHPSLHCCLQQRMQLFIETFIQHANIKTFIQRSITEMYEANYRNIYIALN